MAAQPTGRWAKLVKLVGMVVMVKMVKPNERLFSCSIQRNYSKQNERTEVVLLCISYSSAKYTWQEGWQVYKNKYILEEKNKTTPKVVTRGFISYYLLNYYYINIQHRNLEKTLFTSEYVKIYMKNIHINYNTYIMSTKN